MARGFLEVAAPAAVVVVVVKVAAADAAAGVAEGEDEVPEIYNGDADGHGSDSLQQRLPPREETAVVSMDKEEEEEVRALVRSVCWCVWSVGENRFEMSLWALLSCLRSYSRAFLLCLL